MRTLILLCLSYYVLLSSLILVSFDTASQLLFLVKQRFDVHIMYGSTVGKTLWFPGIILLVAVVSALGERFGRRYLGRLRLTLLVSVFVSSCFLVWAQALYYLESVLRSLKLDPYIDGFHVQRCAGDRLLNEFLSYEHTHSFKSVVATVLGEHANFITGEGFNAIFQIPILWPLASIFAVILSYLLIVLRSPYPSAIQGVVGGLGIYQVVFSFFDGGLLSGTQGLVFIVLAHLQLKKLTPARVLSLLGLFALVTFLSIAVHLLLRYLYTTAPLYASFQAYHYMLIGQSVSRFGFFCLFLALLPRPMKVLQRTLLIAVLLSSQLLNSDHWLHSVHYTQPLKDGSTVLVRLYTTDSVTRGEPLLDSDNLKVILDTVDGDQTGWEYCKELMREIEGKSYRSLTVAIYCIPRVVDLSSPTRLDVGTILYPLEKSGARECSVTCSERVKELFPLKKGARWWYVLGTPDTTRALGLQYCYDVPYATATQRMSRQFIVPREPRTYPRLNRLVQ